MKTGSPAIAVDSPFYVLGLAKVLLDELADAGQLEDLVVEEATRIGRRQPHGVSAAAPAGVRSSVD